jgi:DNA-binding Xre family transcriptional regulator
LLTAEIIISTAKKILAAVRKNVVRLSAKIGGEFMLVFNPKRIFALRGVEKPTSFLVKQGIAPSTAIKFMKAHSSMFKVSYVEMICIGMNCTPNDLFDWYEDSKVKLPENHPLRALERTEKIKNIRELLHDLPVEKLSQVEGLINELKNSE